MAVSNSATKQTVLLLGVFLVGQNSFVAKFGELAQLGRDSSDHGPRLALAALRRIALFRKLAGAGVSWCAGRRARAFGRLAVPRPTPVPTVPAMARPAMPASAISLNVLPEAPDIDSPATALAAESGSTGNVIAMGELRAWRWSRSVVPTIRPRCSPRPGRRRRWLRRRQGAWVQIQQRRRERLDGRGPFTGQACSAFQPLTILSVWVPVTAPMTSKGRATTLRLPNGMSAANVARPGWQVDENRDQVADRAQWVGGGAGVAAGEAPCNAFGTAEKACWIVLCALPAAVPVAWLAAAAWLAEPAGLVFCWGGLNGVSVVAEADDAA